VGGGTGPPLDVPRRKCEEIGYSTFQILPFSFPPLSASPSVVPPFLSRNRGNGIFLSSPSQVAIQGRNKYLIFFPLLFNPANRRMRFLDFKLKASPLDRTLSFRPFKKEAKVPSSPPPPSFSPRYYEKYSTLPAVLSSTPLLFFFC